MIYIALVHYPVINRQGEEIVSAVTNLDVHDIARVAKTYGIAGYYVVTPVKGQQELARKLISHWRKGVGGELNPDRRNALELVKIRPELFSVYEDIRLATGMRPVVYATTGKKFKDTTSWAELRQIMEEGKKSILLLFGTANGLAPSVLQQVDGVVAPIEGQRPYRHLSVRSAVAIALDRLLGHRE